MRSSLSWLSVALLLGATTSTRAQSVPETQVAPPPAYAPPPVYQTASPYPVQMAVVPEPYVLDSEGLRARMQDVKRERAQLIRDGRPDNYLERKVGGLIGVGVGGGAIAMVLVLIYAGNFGPHSGNSVELTSTERVAYPVTAAVGAGVLGVGLWALLSSRGDNPHQQRINQLSFEYDQLARDYKYMRRQEKQQRRDYSLLPSVEPTYGSATRFMLTFSTRI